MVAAYAAPTGKTEWRCGRDYHRSYVNAEAIAWSRLASLLHIAAVFATDVVEGVADLAEAVGFHRFHQRGEDVLAFAGGGLEGSEAWDRGNPGRDFHRSYGQGE